VHPRPMDDLGDVRAYYERDEERDRLTAGASRIEFERTKEILGRALPPPPATIADIGGGPGAYAIWLASLGYEVHHRDLMPLHVEHVRHDASQAGVEVDAAVGDARSLDLDDASVDAVLLLGPLYHLVELEDRLAALREASRILRPDGVLFAAAITRWALRLDGIATLRLYEEFLPERMEGDEAERTGVIPKLHDAAFTGYTHPPRSSARKSPRPASTSRTSSRSRASRSRSRRRISTSGSRRQTASRSCSRRRVRSSGSPSSSASGRI